MPFGMTHPLATFQRALDLALTQNKWRSCLVYIDDVVFFSSTVEANIGHVNFVLQ